MYIYLVRNKQRGGLKKNEHFNVCGCFRKAQDAERTASGKY